MRSTDRRSPERSRIDWRAVAIWNAANARSRYEYALNPLSCLGGVKGPCRGNCGRETRYSHGYCRTCLPSR